MTDPTPQSHDAASREAAAQEKTAQEKTARDKKTLFSMLWSVGTGIGSRIVSLVSTLLVTRFVDPEQYGEVSIAYIVCLAANLIGGFSVGTYVSTRPKATKKELFHAAVIFHVGGAVALVLVYLLRTPLGVAFGGKNIEPYVLGYIVVMLLERLVTIPEAQMVRDERFRTLGLIGSSAEILYSVLVIVLAMRGFGGHSIVYAGIARSAWKASLALWQTNVREWTTVHRWDGETARGVFRFGVPMMIGQLSSLVVRRGDNLAFSTLFGLGRMGAYNLAYNLADMPAITVGERIGDVLVPSFAKLPPKDRPAELARSLGYMAFFVFPLGAGLSCVARPLSLIFTEKWRVLHVDWMLAVLAFLSLTRPLEWAARVYLQVAGATRTIMFLEWAKVAGIMVAIFGLGLAGRAHSDDLGSIGACAAVIATFLASTLAYLFIIARRESFPFTAFLRAMRKPALCVAVMWIGVLALDRYVVAPFLPGLRPGDTGVAVIDKVLGTWNATIGISAGVIAGVVLYVGMAYLVARDEMRVLVRLVRSRKKREVAPSEEAPASEAA